MNVYSSFCFANGVNRDMMYVEKWMVQKRMTINDYKIIKGRLDLYLPLKEKREELLNEIAELQAKIDSMGDIKSPAFFGERPQNPTPQSKIITDLISDQYDLEIQLESVTDECRRLASVMEQLPDYAIDRFSKGLSWKALESKYGDSRQNLEYKIKRAIMNDCSFYV